jgi:hypothetical protein
MMDIRHFVSILDENKLVKSVYTSALMQSMWNI